MDWDAHVEHGRARYEDGESRLAADPDARQKQLVRMAMAAGAAGLALLMQGRADAAAEWFARSADRYRESYPCAPPGSWGRLIGALKARLFAGDRAKACADAAWALEQRPADSESPIGRYAAALAALVLGDDEAAGELAASLRADADGFPAPVAEALAALAARDARAYEDAVRETLRSFEARDAYLEDVPVADTVLALEALAEPRGIRVRLTSPLLPC